MKKIERGTVLAYSWGYGQTQCEFFEVVELTPSGKSARLRKIEARMADTGGDDGLGPMAGRLLPRPGEFVEGEPTILKRIQRGWRGEEQIVTFDHGVGIPVDPEASQYVSWGH